MSRRNCQRRRLCPGPEANGYEKWASESTAGSRDGSPYSEDGRSRVTSLTALARLFPYLEVSMKIRTEAELEAALARLDTLWAKRERTGVSEMDWPEFAALTAAIWDGENRLLEPPLGFKGTRFARLRCWWALLRYRWTDRRS